MNLQNLRDELTMRAATADDRPADLLPGVRTKIRRTRRRRLIAAATAAAAAVAISVAVLPGALSTSTPEPTDRTQHLQNDLPIPGAFPGNTLLRSASGEPGRTHLEFDWAATTKGVAFAPICRIATKDQVWVRINGYTVLAGSCPPPGTTYPLSIAGETGVWADAPAPLGQPAKVTMDLVAPPSGPPAPDDPAQQIGLGIYAERGGPFPAVVPAQPGDYVKNELIIRRKVGPQTLLAATIGDRGQAQVTTTFTSTGGPVALRLLSTTNGYKFGAPYRIQLRLSDGTVISRRPLGGYQAGPDPSATLTPAVPKGQPVTVTATLVYGTNGPTTEPRGTIGVGVYTTD
ncbi:hypothetical protein OG555_08745 [Kribbella sp. NBC_01484]|uniref:hypothetical protein n=1 Tax=Kribbella sp. NBC_01484 TaxID=2903579 RepID=UPI002E2F62B6|nr:hypothetical protein [Kribbella sp. NBC_01484]